MLGCGISSNTNEALVNTRRSTSQSHPASGNSQNNGHRLAALQRQATLQQTSTLQQTKNLANRQAHCTPKHTAKMKVPHLQSLQSCPATQVSHEFKKHNRYLEKSSLTRSQSKHSLPCKVRHTINQLQSLILRCWEDTVECHQLTLLWCLGDINNKLHSLLLWCLGATIERYQSLPFFWCWELPYNEP
jgi:hypothetical protein